MLVLEPKKTSQMYSRNSTTTAQNACVLSFALDSFMFPTLPKVAIEPPIPTLPTLSCLSRYLLLCFQPHRKWPLGLTEWPVGQLATCPVAQLGDYPVGLDAVVGWLANHGIQCRG